MQSVFNSSDVRKLELYSVNTNSLVHSIKRTCAGGIPAGMTQCCENAVSSKIFFQVYEHSSSNFLISRNSEAGAFKNTCKYSGFFFAPPFLHASRLVSVARRYFPESAKLYFLLLRCGVLTA